MAIDAEVQEEAVSVIRSWVQHEVIPKVGEFEHADEYPEDWVEQMKAFGLFGSRIPLEYGGLGFSAYTYA